MQFRGAVFTGCSFLFSPVDLFFPFSPGSLCNLVRKWPQNVEKVAGFPGGEKSVESCHVSGCHGFFRSRKLRSECCPYPEETGCHWTGHSGLRESHEKSCLVGLVTWLQVHANELEHEAMEHAEQISELMTKLDEQMRLNTDLTLLFQPQTVTPHKQHTPIKHLAKGRLWVDSCSIFGRFRSETTKPTKTQPKTDSKLTLSRIPTGVYSLRRGEGLWLK